MHRHPFRQRVLCTCKVNDIWLNEFFRMPRISVVWGNTRPGAGAVGIILLSSNNIVELLTHYLPDRKASEEEIFKQLQIRHEKRQRAIDSAYRKQFLKERIGPD